MPAILITGGCETGSAAIQGAHFEVSLFDTEGVEREYHIRDPALDPVLSFAFAANLPIPVGTSARLHTDSFDSH